MSRRSLDSQTPIMTASAPASITASVRFSISPKNPSTTSQHSDSSLDEIKQLTRHLSRLENKPLSAQRVTLSEQKSDTMSKLALSAKLERALGRRMTNQDAVYRYKVKAPALTEKVIQA